MTETQYPTVGLDDCLDILRRRIAGEDVSISDQVAWKKAGDPPIMDDLDDFADDLSEDLPTFDESDDDKDVIEGKLALRLLDALEGTGMRVLDDQGFWRYLAMGPMWDFVRWRESGKSSDDWEAYRIYVDGRRNAECVPTRMYIRARLAEKSGDRAIAHLVPEATDLWRSHIVRVRTSYSPTLTEAIIRSQHEDRLATDGVRELAKRVKRLRSNVVLGLYDQDDARSVVAELREEI